jgi:hypothetical protein
MSGFRNVEVSSYLEFWMMNIVHNLSDSELVTMLQK